MPSCKCNDCRQCAARVRDERQQEPEERRSKKGLYQKGERKKSKKQLNDLLKQAEKDLWLYIDWYEERRPGGAGYLKYQILRLSKELADLEAHIRTLEEST